MSCLARPCHWQRFTTVPANRGPRLGVQVVAGLLPLAGLPPAAGVPIAGRTVILSFPLPSLLRNPRLEGLRNDVFPKEFQVGLADPPGRESRIRDHAPGQ